MAVSSLLPEPPLWFSPGLAATIGLEEAILLQQLAGLRGHREADQREGRAWLGVERHWLAQQLPFWDEAAIQRIARNLAEQGLIHLQMPPPRPGDALYFALDEGKPANANAAAAPRPASGKAAVTPDRPAPPASDSRKPVSGPGHSATPPRRHSPAPGLGPQ